MANLKKVYDGRLTEEYVVSQVNGFFTADTHIAHHKRISDYDALYQGDLSALFPNETALPKEPLVANKVKNATHDLARLSNEAQGAPAFMREGDKEKDQKAAAIREVIAETLWRQGGGPRLEMPAYLDLISAGDAAIYAYRVPDKPFPVYMQLNPRFCYPDVVNGELVSLLYCETLKERQAAALFPDLGITVDQNSAVDVENIIFFDKQEVVQGIGRRNKAGQLGGFKVASRWIHDLGVVPVAFRSLDSPDRRIHGLLDQLGGPLMTRNKTIRLLVDYLESMAHAPFESKNVINANDEPGPNTIYQHDPNSDESFMRRVAPAAPAGAIFGLLQYADSQESEEAVQPPARVGVVNQSIASGTFVASTQGTLSSLVKELQFVMADLRQQLGVISMKIDEKFLDFEKPLWKAIGNKYTYTPSKDIGGWHNHIIQYGAAAGLNRTEADTRTLQHLGAQLISKQTARAQLDYLDDITREQERIDQEHLADVFFQRFSADPNTPMTILARAIELMGSGKSLVEVVTEILPEFQQNQEQQRQDAMRKQMGPGAPMEPTTPEEQQASLQAGGQLIKGVQFSPNPLQQNFVRNPVS